MTRFFWNSLVTMLLLVFIIGIGRMVKSAQAAGNVNVLSCTGYVDSIGDYHVVGEVLNNEEGAVDFVKVDATFYDSQNTQITKRFDSTMLNILLPGRRSPFDIALLDEAQSALVDHFGISITFSNAFPIPIGLQILSNSSYIDEVGSLHVNGTLENIAEDPVRNVKVVATYYNLTGEVVAARMKDLGIEGVLMPNQTVPFEIVLDEERTQYAYRYELTAESNEYAIVPELAPHALVSLVYGTVVIALVIQQYRKSAHRGANAPASVPNARNYSV